MEQVISYHFEGGVATITLNRAAKRNALSTELVMELGLALEEAAVDHAVRVVVLTGAGGTFSAGADLEALREMQSATAMENEEGSRRLATLFKQIYTHPKPVIAKITGHAIGGGCGLAAVCDISIATEEARLGFSEVRIGFVPAIVSVFILRKLSETTARDLLLRGNVISAAEAAALGLITRAVERARLEEAVASVAADFVNETSASAVALTKRMLALLPGMGLDEGLAYAAQLNAFARATPDCRAGVEAFLQKKDPPWRPARG